VYTIYYVRYPIFYIHDIMMVLSENGAYCIFISKDYDHISPYFPVFSDRPASTKRFPPGHMAPTRQAASWASVVWQRSGKCTIVPLLLWNKSASLNMSCSIQMYLKLVLFPAPCTSLPTFTIQDTLEARSLSLSECIRSQWSGIENNYSEPYDN